MNLRLWFLATLITLFALITACQKVVEPEEEPLSTIDTVFVFGGTFQMGEGGTEADELPVHAVTLSSFQMTKTEVTQKMWREVVEWGKEHGGTTLNSDPSGFNGDDLPVEMVNYDDVTTWLGILNEREKLDSNLYRLPTEAEWEYAARGGSLSSGTTYAGSNDIDAVAWYGTTADNTTHAVGSKAANELGLFDMSGNVYEWCLDGYAAYPATPQTDPVQSGALPVIRGGSWQNVRAYCRVADRGNNVRGARGRETGFRIVRPL